MTIPRYLRVFSRLAMCYCKLYSAYLSLNELAEKSGITRTGISSLIHGRTNATPKTIGLLAKALNVDVEDIVDFK